MLRDHTSNQQHNISYAQRLKTKKFIHVPESKMNCTSSSISGYYTIKVNLARFQTLLISYSMSLLTPTPFQTSFWKDLKSCDVRIKRG